MQPHSHFQAQRFLNFSGNIGALAHDSIRQVQGHVTVADASRLLLDQTIDFLIVMDNEVPVGIINKSDIIAHGLTHHENDGSTAREVMKSQIISVQKNMPVMEALLFMIRHNLEYLLVLDGKSPLGVVTPKDWMSVKVNYPMQLLQQIEAAVSIDMLSKLRLEGKKYVWENFVKEGNAVSLSQIVTMINDSITRRVIRLSLDRMQATGYGVPPVSFAWIGMGSEGRKAQTVRTDQDNGLIFENVNPDQYESVKKWFLTFSDHVVKGLEICGFPLCEGNVMATNPELCNAIGEWKGLFERIISRSDAKELLEASIYFDFRCVYGNSELTDKLWTYLFEVIDEYPFFLRKFAENILEASRPPVRKWQWRLPLSWGVIPPAFNLKRQASAPLDAAIRLLALNYRLKETSTLGRLKEILELGKMSKTLADEVSMAFDFISRLRFRMEFNMDDKKDIDHVIVPASLIPLQLRYLKKALKAIYELQDFTFRAVTGIRVPWSMR